MAFSFQFNNIDQCNVANYTNHVQKYKSELTLIFGSETTKQSNSHNSFFFLNRVFSFQSAIIDLIEKHMKKHLTLAEKLTAETASG